MSIFKRGGGPECKEFFKGLYSVSCDTLSGIFRALGAVEQTRVDANNPATFTWMGKKYQYRGAGHLMGTYRMGADGKDSVVDGQCRSFDHKNLILLGSGVFPSSATGNPTLTLLALAVRAADTVLRDDFNIVSNYID